MIFTAANYTINLDNGGSWTGGGLTIGSTNTVITFIGTANTHLNATATWTVAAGSTLILDDTRQSFDAAGTVKGFNWNSRSATFAGGGTFNFQTPFGCNSTAVNTENNPGGVVNLLMNPVTSTASAGTYSGGFTLTAGTLNFASAGSAEAFYGFTAPSVCNQWRDD